jgi:hypothetical protein
MEEDTTYLSIPWVICDIRHCGGGEFFIGHFTISSFQRLVKKFPEMTVKELKELQQRAEME